MRELEMMKVQCQDWDEDEESIEYRPDGFEELNSSRDMPSHKEL
jgi:hypothetical protein